MMHDSASKRRSINLLSLSFASNHTDLAEYLKRGLGNTGAKLWNSQPQELRLADSTSSFRNMNCQF